MPHREQLSTPDQNQGCAYTHGRVNNVAEIMQNIFIMLMIDRGYMHV